MLTLSQNGDFKSFEQKLNGEFALPVESIPHPTQSYPVIVEFKESFEVESVEIMFKLDEQSKGALVKTVTYDL